MALQLDAGDDEAEQAIRMGIERRATRNLRDAMNELLAGLYPQGYGEFADPNEEAARIQRAWAESQRLRDTVGRAIQDSADLGVNVAVRQFENIGLGFDWTLANASAREWADRHTDDLLRQLGTTTHEAVGPVLRRWVDNGEPLEMLIQDLEPLFGANRAARIASTETTRAYTQGNLETYRASNVTKRAEWRTANDEKVCPICAPLNGVRSDNVQSPTFRHPDGTFYGPPPAHPRCILPGNVIVAPGRIVAAAKSFYDGPAVEIAIGSGRKLTVTANHPILTGRGWIAADQVCESDHVFSSRHPERIAAIVNPDGDNMPALIEDIFASFVMANAMVPISVPVSAEDFHGDGEFIKSDVQIVGADGLLEKDGKFRACDHIAELPFDFGDTSGGFHTESTAALLGKVNLASAGGVVGGAYLHGPLDFGHALPLDKLGLGLSPERNSISAQKRSEFGTTNTRRAAKTVHGFSSEIPGNPVMDSLALGHHSGFGVGPNLSAIATQKRSKASLSDASRAAEFVHRFASEIAVDPVISVRKFKFSGHVYDLQVDPWELYFTESIITHNCRCWLVPVVEGIEN
jgi:SPP1 gp7 family putative phage head morphogenesis protein